MQINSIQINYNCGKNFHFCLENGSEDYLFVIFKSQCSTYTSEGYVKTPAGSFALFDKKLKQEYFCFEEEFVHDYIRFNYDGNGTESIMYNIPFHRIFTPDSINELENLIKLMSAEFYSDSKYRDKALNFYMKLILLKAAEYSSTDYTDLKTIKYFEFLDLRANIYSNPQNYTSIEEIAKTFFLSKPHFHNLYKKYFNTTCMNDIISARIEKAKMFISDTNKSISEISYLCGYSNIEHFIRQFKKSVGITPTVYRKKSNNSFRSDKT